MAALTGGFTAINRPTAASFFAVKDTVCREAAAEASNRVCAPSGAAYLK
jgi:hypothetical protein